MPLGSDSPLALDRIQTASLYFLFYFYCGKNSYHEIYPLEFYMSCIVSLTTGRVVGGSYLELTGTTEPASPLPCAPQP